MLVYITVGECNYNLCLCSSFSCLSLPSLCVSLSSLPLSSPGAVCGDLSQGRVSHCVVSDAVDPSTYPVLTRVHLVKQQWFWESIQIEACADEQLYQAKVSSMIKRLCLCVCVRVCVHVVCVRMLVCLSAYVCVHALFAPCFNGLYPLPHPTGVIPASPPALPA